MKKLRQAHHPMQLGGIDSRICGVGGLVNEKNGVHI